MASKPAATCAVEWKATVCVANFLNGVLTEAPTCRTVEKDLAEIETPKVVACEEVKVRSPIGRDLLGARDLKELEIPPFVAAKLEIYRVKPPSIVPGSGKVKPAQTGQLKGKMNPDRRLPVATGTTVLRQNASGKIGEMQRKLSVGRAPSKPETPIITAGIIDPRYAEPGRRAGQVLRGIHRINPAGQPAELSGSTTWCVHKVSGQNPFALRAAKFVSFFIEIIEIFGDAMRHGITGCYRFTPIKGL